MASLIGSLYVSLTADFAPFQRDMRSAEGVVASTSSSMRRNIGLTERSVSQFQRTTSSGIKPYALISAARTFDTVQQRANLLRGAIFATTAAFGGLTAALTTNVISRYLDSFTGLKNQVRVVAADSGDLVAQMTAIDQVATRSRSSLGAVATLYARMQKASPDASAAQTLRRVETINKALQLGGATAQESASAAIQFSQAIQSNRLGGDELRAVLETPLGGELAKGLGVSIGQLRKLSKEGKLTTEALYGSLDKISGSIDAKFAKSATTVDRALINADNKITEFAGHLDETYGITKLLTSGINSFADNLDSIVPLLTKIGIGFGLAFASKGITGVVGRSIVAPLKEASEIRRTNIALAAEELQKAKQIAATADARVAAARGLTPAGAAPRSLVQAAVREESALAAIKKQQVDLVSKQVAIQQKLGNVTAQTTSAAVKAADSIAKGEARVNDLIGSRGNLYKKNTRLTAQLNSFNSGLTEQSKRLPENVATQQSIIAQRKAVQLELAKINDQIARERAGLAAATARAAQLEVDAEARAAAQRIAIGKELTIAQKQQALARMQAQIQQGRIESARGNINSIGGAIAGRAVYAAESEAAQAARGIAAAESRLTLFTRAAGAARVGISTLATVGGSLISFLGGPWAVGLLAAAGALTYFGVKSEEAAVKHQRFLDIVKENVADVAENGQGPSAEQAQLSILDDRIKAINEQLGVTRDGYQQIIDKVGDWVKFMNEADKTADQLAGGLYGKFADDFKAFEDGKISLEALILRTKELRKEADGLGAAGKGYAKNFDGLINAMGSLRDAIKDPTIAIQNLIDKVKDLDGQRAKIIIDIERRSNSDADRDDFVAEAKRIREAKEKADRKAYGQRYEGQREAQANAQKRLDVLDDASDQGDKALNTLPRISKREQQLLEEGYTNVGTAYGTAREAAHALAVEELNLKEKQRLASKSIQAQTSDLEKLKTMVKELTEEASGSFLGDLDQQVLAKAKSLKDGSKYMADYIAAIKSGDLSSAPPELLKIRDALQEIGAASTWREIINNYGHGAQLAGQFADKQKELTFLVSTGRITAQQAGDAWADYIGQFQDYKWIDSTASAISDFADSAITDFKNIGDAFEKLGQDLLKIALQQFVLGPLNNILKDWFGQLAGGGFSGGAPNAGTNPLQAIASIFTGNLGKSVQGAAPQQVTAGGATSVGNAIATAVQNFSSAGSTKTGIPLSEVTTQGLTAKLSSQYADRFAGLFKDLEAAGYKITSLGEGGYSYRNVAGTSNLSKHSFGEAIDINPRQNPQAYGATGNFGAYGIDPAALAEKNGLKWGGDWNKPDTMHFQVDKSIKKLGDTADMSSKSLGDMTNSISKTTESLGMGSSSGSGAGGGGLVGALTGIMGKSGSSNSGLLGNLQVGDHGSAFGAIGDLGAGGTGSSGIFKSISDSFSKLLGGIFGPDGILSSLLSGAGDLFGGLLGGLGGILGSIFHEGGRVGSGGRTGVFSAGVFKNAPRYHKGNLKGQEVAAVLQKGEAVLQARHADRMVSTVNGMTKRVAEGGGGSGLTVQFIDNVGVKKKQERTRGPDGDVLRIMIEEVVDQGVGRGKFDNSFGQRYGAKPQPVKR